MRSTNVTYKLIDTYLGKDVYDEYGKLLLGKKVKLTSSLIDKLVDNEIYYVYVDDELSRGIDIQGIISDEHMIKSVTQVKKVLNNVMKNEKKGIQKMIPQEDIKAVREIVKDLIDALENSENTLFTVVDLMSADMYTYKHSINVAILSILTCRALGYDYELTKHIALGALLHDVGKALVKDQLILKREQLTDDEFEEVKSHASYGYDLIKDEITLSGYTKQIVRLHHEKRDGSGYPLGLKETEIPDFVRIVTICDIFDAMSSDRIYRSRMPIYQVIDNMLAETVYKLDPVILQMFIKNICVYPPGSGVRLCDGRMGIVEKYDKFTPTRPIVRLFEDKDGNRKINKVDLQRERVLFIKDTIETDYLKEHYNL